ncbi:MAG: hypothetical protein K5978_01620 [Campylobacter sp.]|nr:hypothetical protein [Campylobacter sp.]
MRKIFSFVLAAVFTFAYEIKHENIGTLYHFIGYGDGDKFEVFIKKFDHPFENFKNKDIKIFPKFSGHIFFRGEKIDFDKGELEKNDGEISLSALSKWIKLDLNGKENGELSGKIALRGKSSKANATLKKERLLLAFALQHQNQARYEGLACDFYGSQITPKHKNTLGRILRNSLKTSIETSPQIDTNFIYENELLFENEHIRTACKSLNHKHKTCITVNQKNGKVLAFADIFNGNKKEQISKILKEAGLSLDAKFYLSPLGLCSNDDKCINFKQIKGLLKHNFALF